MKSFSRTHPPWSELLKLVDKWLSDCNRHHVDCRTSEKNRELPTRLLAIFNGEVKVTSTIGLPTNTKYVTLSHCWGKGDVVKLTKESLLPFGKFVPQDRLCKTFKDAILIASSLDVAYLWIDSLCIVQDDQQEWRHESVQMSRIYGNSYLNIAAAGARDGSEGCFFGKEKHRISPFHVQIKDSNNMDQFYNCIPQMDIYNTCVTETPLASRAWTLQERLLSPRNLYFSRTQLLWECNEKVSSESFPDQVPMDISIASDGASSPWRKGALSDSWKSILAMYTAAHMTREEDKLPAISGIARKIAEQTGNECVAGLWRHKMETELLWFCVEPGNKPVVYRAPSWSWAAVDSEISFDESYDHQELWADVLEAHVTPQGEDPLGELRDGDLQIVCRSLLQSNVEPAGRWSSTNLLGVVFEHEWTRVFSIEVFWDFVISGCQINYEEFYLLPLKLQREDGSVLSGLVLRPTGEVRGQYCRVGLFRHIETENDHDSKLFLPTIKLKEEEYSDYINDGRHRGKHWVITII